MARLAFCGLGQMGAPMASRLVDAGHDVIVWNRTRSRTEPLAGRGARVAGTPAEAADGVEAAITMVSDPAALLDVVLGEDGLAGGFRPGATLIEMSTVGPQAVRELAERLPKGVGVLDAPVLGSTPAAEEGSLTILVGGDRAEFDRWRGVLEVMGDPRYLGGLGLGASMKLVANSALGAAMSGLGEALALADRLGVAQDAALDILSGGPYRVVIERTRAAIESGEFPPRFKLSLAEKDLRLVDQAARDVGLELRVAPAAQSWYAEADAAGRGDEDYPAVIEHIRSAGG